MKAGEEADKPYHVILPCSLPYALAWYFSITLCNPHRIYVVLRPFSGSLATQGIVRENSQ